MEQLSLFSVVEDITKEVEEMEQQPLTNEQKIELIRQGAYDINQFLEDNRKLIFKVQNKILSGRMVKTQDLDDFESLGLYALYKATQDFDPTKGYKFSTFAYKYILTELQMYYHRRVHKHTFQTKYHLELDALEVDMIEGNPHHFGRQRYTTEGLELNERQQAIYQAYLESLSFTEVAKQFGISRQCICESVQRTQAKMRKKYYA